MKAIKNFIIKSQLNDDNSLDRDFINLAFKPIIAILFSLMIVITFTQVIFRYLLNSALPWAGEITIFLFIWVIFLGAAITLSKGLHIGVDIFTSFLNKKNKNIVLTLTNLLVILFCFLIIVGSAPLIVDNFTQRSPALEIRISYVYAVIPISMTSMIWITIKKIIRGNKN
jgi:TRAP-type C4-dicarboxylate transport system permease small subunit